MTDWDIAYMNKPTNIEKMYPTTEKMMAALEEAAFEHKVTVVSRILTALIFLMILAVSYHMYPEFIEWLIKQYQ